MALEITHPSSEEHARHVFDGYANASLYLHRFLDKLTQTLDDPEQVFTTGPEIAEARLMLNVLDQLRPSTFTARLDALSNRLTRIEQRHDTQGAQIDSLHAVLRIASRTVANFPDPDQSSGGDSTNAQFSPVKVEPSTLGHPLWSVHDAPPCDGLTREPQFTTCGGQSCLQSQTRTPRPSRQGAFVGTPNWDAMVNVYGRPESCTIERAAAAAASITATSGEPSQHESSTRACPTEATWTVCRGPTSTREPTSIESAQTTQTPPDTTISELCAASSNTPVQAPSSTLSSPRSACSSIPGKRARSPSTSASDSSCSSHLDGASDYRPSGPSPDLSRKLRRVSRLHTLRLCDTSPASADSPSSTSTSTSSEEEHEFDLFDITGPYNPEATLGNLWSDVRDMRSSFDAMDDALSKLRKMVASRSTDKRSPSPSHSAASPCCPPPDTQEKEPAQTIVAVAASEIPAQS